MVKFYACNQRQHTRGLKWAGGALSQSLAFAKDRCLSRTARQEERQLLPVSMWQKLKPTAWLPKWLAQGELELVPLDCHWLLWQRAVLQPPTIKCTKQRSDGCLSSCVDVDCMSC